MGHPVLFIEIIYYLSYNFIMKKYFISSESFVKPRKEGKTQNLSGPNCLDLKLYNIHIDVLNFNH